MAWFNFGKKKEEKKAPACCCSAEPKATGCCDAEPKATGCCDAEPKATDCCCGKPVDSICCIKVLGAGCKACHEQYENVKEAMSSLGLSVPVEYITDMEQIMEYGIMSMPAILINDRVASHGKVLSTRDVKKLLAK